MEYPTSPLYFLKHFGIKISDKCDIPWYTIKNLCITILYLAVENIVHDGMVGFNTIKYSMLSRVLIGCIFWNGIDISENKTIKQPCLILRSFVSHISVIVE